MAAPSVLPYMSSSLSVFIWAMPLPAKLSTWLIGWNAMVEMLRGRLRRPCLRPCLCISPSDDPLPRGLRRLTPPLYGPINRLSFGIIFFVISSSALCLYIPLAPPFWYLLVHECRRGKPPSLDGGFAADYLSCGGNIMLNLIKVLVALAYTIFSRDITFLDR